MLHELYPSVEAMLSPEALSALEGRTVSAVCTGPFVPDDSKSGSRFARVETLDEGGQDRRRYVLKRLRWEWDWIMRATDDRRCRSVLVWQDGLLDRLPADLVHGVVACAADDRGRAVLMRDFGDALIPSGETPIGSRENECLLEVMPALHAAFWDQPQVVHPSRGYCDLRQRYAELTPATARRESANGAALPPVVAGWDLLRDGVEPDVVEVLFTLAEDPQPLCAALGRYPQTVVHGDWKLGNLGLLPAPRRSQVVLLDWAVVGPAPPAVDLAWYLAVNPERLPTPKEVCIALYKGGLEGRLGNRFDECWWEPQLALSLLGSFVQLGWGMALDLTDDDEAVRARGRAELAWWSERAREALKWL